MSRCSQKKISLSRLFTITIGTAVFLFLASSNSYANHPVFVEGNCLAVPVGTNSVTTNGTCGDYDGDGRIGTAEDNDGDNVFGTLEAANGVTGANNNGTITIVTSGVFNPVNFQLSGNITLQAAPGVTAIIDAVLAGDPTNNNAVRQSGTGISILASSFRRIAVRNITVKNFRTGIIIQNAYATLENVKIENNVDYGVRVQATSTVSIMNSSITSTGYRQSAAGDFPNTSTPAPGFGLSFEGASSGNIVSSNVSNNFARGIDNSGTGNVCVSQSSLINNGVNIGGAVTFSANGCFQ